jgi:hypothetical protein
MEWALFGEVHPVVDFEVYDNSSGSVGVRIELVGQDKYH